MVGKISIKLTGLLGLLTSLIFILSAARCDDEKPFASQELTFIIPATIEPTDDTLNIRDTLWLYVNSPDSLYEFNTKKKYKVPDFSFGQTSIIVRRLVGSTIDLSDQESAVSNFNLIDSTGSIVFLGETFVDIKFHYDDILDRYMLKLGFNPKMAGVYCLQFLGPDVLNYEGVIDLGKNDKGATIVPVYKGMYFPINENSNDNNYQLFKDNCLSLYSGSSDSVGYYREFKGTFTFRVVE